MAPDVGRAWTPAARPWTALALAATLTAALGWAATGLELHDEVEDFFSAETPDGAAYQRYLARFGRDDATALVVVEGAAPPTLADLRRLAALGTRLRGIAGIAQVTTPADVPIAVRDADGVVSMQPALRPSDLESGNSARLRLALTRFAQPPLRDHVLSADGKVWVVTARLAPDALDARSRRRISAALEDAAVPLRSDGFTVRIAGYPIHRARFAAHIGEESRRLLPLAALAVALVLLVGMRSLAAVAVPLVVSLVSLAWTLGLMALLGVAANILAPALVILVLLVGTADTVHLVARWGSLRRSGEAARAAAAHALADLLAPCWLTSLTTALAFGGLWLTRIPLIAEFGVGVAIGVLAGFAAAMLVAPALLALWPQRSTPEPDRAPPPPGWLERGLTWLDGATARWPHRAIALTAAIAVAAALGATQVRINSPLLGDLAPEHPVRQTNDFLEARLGGVIPVDLVLAPPAGAPAVEAYAAERMARVERLTAHLRRLDGVRTATGPVDVLRALQPLLRDVAAADVLAMTPGAMLLAAEQMRPFVDSESHTLRIRTRIANLDTAAAIALFAQMRAAYQQAFGEPAPPDLLTGQGYLGQQINLGIVDHFARSFVVSVALILATLLVAFRSARWAGYAMLANAFPLLVVLGVMGLSGVELRYTSALALCVAFGLAVDDTIHALAQIRANRGEGDPIEGAFAKGGPGMVWTSVVLIAGFGVLTDSTFVANRVLGTLLVVAAIAALWGDLVLLPALLRRRSGGADVGPLQAAIVPVARLSAAARASMFSLFCTYYDRTDPGRFVRDLDAKDYVVLLRVRGVGPIAGFTTVRIEPIAPALGGGRVIYSGDTVVAEAFRGQAAMRHGFFALMLATRARYSGPLYWLLTTKGYKTYLLLTHNFSRSWPRVGVVTPARIHALRAALGAKLFGAAYDPATGVARLEARADRVRPEHVALGKADLLDPDIAYFAAIHPGHIDGDELVCVAEVRWRDILVGLLRLQRRRAARAGSASAVAAEGAP